MGWGVTVAFDLGGGGGGGPVNSVAASGQPPGRTTHVHAPGSLFPRMLGRCGMMLSLMHQDQKGCCSHLGATKCKPDHPRPHTSATNKGLDRHKKRRSDEGPHEQENKTAGPGKRKTIGEPSAG